MRLADKTGYTRGADIYPSVTTICGIVKFPEHEYYRNRVGDIIADARMCAKGEKGKDFHWGARLICSGLEPKGVKDPEVKGKLKLFKPWYDLNIEDVYSTELEIISEKYIFGGTADLICKVKGIKGRVLVDYKTGSINRSHYWQGSAYKHGYEEDQKEKISTVMILDVKSNRVKPIIIDHVDKFFTEFLYVTEIARVIKRGTK